MPHVNRTFENKYDRLDREAKEDRQWAAELKADKSPADCKDFLTVMYPDEIDRLVVKLLLGIEAVEERTAERTLLEISTHRLADQAKAYAKGTGGTTDALLSLCRRIVAEHTAHGPIYIGGPSGDDLETALVALKELLRVN